MAIRKARKHLIVVRDPERVTVEFIGEDRKASSLGDNDETFSQDKLAHVKAVAIDMRESYIASVKTGLPDRAEKIVFDRFHVMGHVGTAVDVVRMQEHRSCSDKASICLPALGTCSFRLRRTSPTTVINCSPPSRRPT